MGFFGVLFRLHTRLEGRPWSWFLSHSQGDHVPFSLWATLSPVLAAELELQQPRCGRRGTADCANNLTNSRELGIHGTVECLGLEGISKAPLLPWVQGHELHWRFPMDPFQLRILCGSVKSLSDLFSVTCFHPEHFTCKQSTGHPGMFG